MSLRQRAFRWILSLGLSVAVATPASAGRELHLMDSAWPSVGPGSNGPHAPPQWVEIEVEKTGEPPPLPRSSVDSAPGPSTPGVSLGFSGVDGSFKGAPDCCAYKPPDTSMAVGTGAGAAGRVVEVTNSGIQIWDKTGTSLAGPTPLITFLPAIPNPCSASCPEPFDPKVLFDQHSGRFFIVVLEGRHASPNPSPLSNVHLAVSTSSTPSNLTTDWTKLSGSALTTIGGIDTWFDYPGIGADSDSLFVTGNMFDDSGFFRGVKIRVFDKAMLLAGSYTFVDINVDAAVTSGAFTVQPAHVYGATDSGHFYLINRFGSTAYRLWEISGDPGAPVIVGNATRSWSAGSEVSSGAPQMGSAVVLDTLSSRIINAVYRDGHVWCALSSDTDFDGKTEVFWAKIATNGGLPSVPTVADSGFIDGSDGNEWTFQPSINVNSANDATIVYTQSFTDQFPEMRYVSRAVTDPAGTFQSSVVAATSPGFYDDFGAPAKERWGDYSATVVDPADDLTFWVANEVVLSSGVDTSFWNTFIAKLGAVTGVPTPTPTTTTTPTPTATPTCGAAPVAGCRTPAVGQKALLLLKDQADSTKDKLIWKWIKGSATSKVPDFGTPLTSTSYILCIYDSTPALISSAVAPADELCNVASPTACWADKPTGFKYKDVDLTPNGVQQILLKEGLAEKAKIIVKGKGANLVMPSMPLSQPVTVQLRNSTGVCWEAVYSAPAIKNEAGPPGQFKDKAD